MRATRTQIYLTAAQRVKLDAIASREERTLADVIREAVDRYLEHEPGDTDVVLAATFGASPEFAVPSRAEWDRS